MTEKSTSRWSPSPAASSLSKSSRKSARQSAHPSGPTSAAAVDEMVRLELLDDARFAAQKAAWLKTRHKSRREAQRQLAEKGVDRNLIDEALDEVYGDGDEREEIDRLIRRSYAAKLENGKRDAVYAALCRRGFSPRTVREVLNDWADAQQEGWDE